MSSDYTVVKKKIQPKFIEKEKSLCDSCKYRPITWRDVRDLGFKCYKSCNVTYFIRQCPEYGKETATDVYIPETNYRAPLIEDEVKK